MGPPDFNSAFLKFINGGNNTAPLPVTSLPPTPPTPLPGKKKYIPPYTPARISPEKINTKETPKPAPLAKPNDGLTPKPVVYARNEKGQFAGIQKNDNLTPRTGVPSANPNYNLTPKNVSSANLTPRSVSSANPNYNLTPKTSPLVRPNYNMTPKTTSSVKPNYSLTPKNVDYKKVQQKTSVFTETIDISNDEFTDGFDIFGRPNNRKNFFDQDFDSDSSNTLRLIFLLFRKKQSHNKFL